MNELGDLLDFASSDAPYPHPFLLRHMDKLRKNTLKAMAVEDGTGPMEPGGVGEEEGAEQEPGGGTGRGTGPAGAPAPAASWEQEEPVAQGGEHVRTGCSDVEMAGSRFSPWRRRMRRRDADGSGFDVTGAGAEGEGNEEEGKMEGKGGGKESGSGGRGEGGGEEEEKVRGTGGGGGGSTRQGDADSELGAIAAAGHTEQAPGDNAETMLRAAGFLPSSLPSTSTGTLGLQTITFCGPGIRKGQSFNAVAAKMHASLQAHFDKLHM